jgi:hypothetical protein
MIPSFVIPAASCPPTGVRGWELRPSKLARVSSARYYIAGESRLYQSTRLARRRPSSLPLRPRRHFRRAVPLGRCYGGDGMTGSVHTLLKGMDCLFQDGVSVPSESKAAAHLWWW